MIQEYFSQVRKSELMMGSLIIITLTFLGNLFSYLFQFFMARMLGPSDYVIVAIITSIMGIFAIPTMAIQTLISKNTTELKVKKQEGKIKGMMNYALGRMLMLSIFFFISYSIFSLYLASKLGINYIYLFISGLFIFSSFTYPILTGIVQGLKKFKELGINFFINCFVKFIAGVVLVLAGLRVYGAIMGFILGVTAAFFILFFNINSLIDAKPKKFKINIFSRENAYPLGAMLIMVLLYSLDVIFAKIFFPSDIAGRYSVISLIGKTIFFVVSSIGTAMFPINTERHAAGGNTKTIFKKALLLSTIICSLAIIVLSVFPKLIVDILFGAQYASAYNLLTYSSFAFSFSALLYLMVLYDISTNKIKLREILLLLFFLIIETLLFFIFNQSIENFTAGFLISNMIAFFVFWGYSRLRR